MHTASQTAVTARRPFGHYLFGWLDADNTSYHRSLIRVKYKGETLEIDRYLPFLFLHIGCLGVIWTGWSPVAVGVAAALYFLRMFAITGFYHRYFSHRTFQTNRFWQAIFAVWGLTSVQRGPLWWAAHHRHHHRASDQEGDVHSPIMNSLWYSHIGWIADSRNMVTHYDRVPDLAKYPELLFLNRFDWIAPILLFFSMFGLGHMLSVFMPELGTSGWQIVVWGFFISTTLLFHGTCSINSLSHLWGKQRYETPDKSRNNFLLALITLGEGWHNNHHKYQGTVRQGFFWWEVDITFYGLWLMSKLGIVKNLHPVPASAYRKQK